ncbi:MAG: M23 family metallopeptidase [Deltaproteobacteria bacterium]|nr:M23 family metallopeptidase [Deltaproteobacteria bacterium]
MTHKGGPIRGKMLALLIIALVVGGGIFLVVRDKEGPVLTLIPDSPYVSLRPLVLELKDEQSGLRSLEISAIQKEKEITLLARDYPERPRHGSETFSLKQAPLAEGPFILRILAKDGSFLGGKGTLREYSLNFDRTPPVISVLSRTHNVRQGGSAVVVFSLSEQAAVAGVRVGERKFPAFKQPSGNYFCFFGFPFEIKKDTFQPLVFAEDLAGNQVEGGFYFNIRVEKQRQDRINISDQFLNAKMPQFKNDFPDAKNPLEVFLKVNQVLRVKNRQMLFDYGAKSVSEPLWQGAFLRQPGATMATFGDLRSYYYQGRKIDSQTHLGVDIASVAQSPIKAANSGRVIFAGFFGIYGSCVIVDHGLGLQTLYGHLTRIDVSEGQEVKKNVLLGTSGATGMAGGDHLHFGIILSGLPVDPIEWWDPNWVKNNIEDKIGVNNPPERKK